MTRRRIDGHDTFRRIDALSQNQLADLLHIGDTRLFDGLGPQQHAEVRCFYDIAGDPFTAIARPETLHEGLVLGAAQRLKVAPCRVVPGHIERIQRAQLRFADRQRHHRRLAGIQTSLAQPPIEREIRIADDRADDHVRLGGTDARNGIVDVLTAEEHVFLAHDLATQGRNLVTDDLVHTVRPDVIRTHQEHAATEVVQAPFQCGKDLLIGCGAGVDDVRRDLEPFVGHRIDQQVPGLLDHGLHMLAAGGSPAPDDGADILRVDQPFRLAGKGRPVGGPVRDHGFQRSPKEATGRIDLLYREQLGIDQRLFADGHRTGQRVQDTQADRLRRVKQPVAVKDGQHAQRQEDDDGNGQNFPFQRSPSSFSRGPRLPRRGSAES